MFDSATLNETFVENSRELSSTLSLLYSYSTAGLVLVPNEPTNSSIKTAAKVTNLSESQLRRVYQILINSAE